MKMRGRFDWLSPIASCENTFTFEEKLIIVVNFVYTLFFIRTSNFSFGAERS